MTPNTYYCLHCQTTHTLPPRTTEPLAETVKHNHALRVARLRLWWLFDNGRRTDVPAK